MSTPFDGIRSMMNKQNELLCDGFTAVCYENGVTITDVQITESFTGASAIGIQTVQCDLHAGNPKQPLITAEIGLDANGEPMVEVSVSEKWTSGPLCTFPVYASDGMILYPLASIMRSRIVTNVDGTKCLY